MEYIIRKAGLADREAIEQLIADSARKLSQDDYSDEQIEAAIKAVFGVDTNLILDDTYFVAESFGTLIGCGGWSRRRTLFGGDQFPDRDSSQLDPKTEAAKIRAFFVRPKFARMGVARTILSHCEREARAHGFRALELMSTLPGIKLYQACGYEGAERVAYDLGEGVVIEFMVMKKKLE